MGLKGAKTSKRWNLTKWLAMLIFVSGWGACGILAAFYEWELFARIASATIIALAGLGSTYIGGESYAPHVSPEDNTIIINQGNDKLDEFPEANEPA